MYLICRKIPVGIANSKANAYPFGLRDAGELSYYLGVHYSHPLDSSPQSVVQCGKGDGLGDSTDVKLRCLT